MGRDKFGTRRGKCGICEECYEYTAPVDEVTLACEYCDHKPIYHVEIVTLGTCGCGKCPGYTSRLEYQYTSCDYCDCGADKHLGYEKVLLEVQKAKQRSSQYDLEGYQSEPNYTQSQMVYTQDTMDYKPFLRHSNQTQALLGLDQSEPDSKPQNYATQVLKFSFVGCIGVIIAIKIIYEVFLYIVLLINVVVYQC